MVPGMWRRAREHAGGVLRFVGGVACLLVLGACATRSPVPQASGAGASPVVRGAEDGLEVWWWIVSDSRVVPPAPLSSLETQPVGPEAPSSDPAPPPRLEVLDLKSSIAEILSTYEPGAAPTDEAARGRCHTAGLRLIAVPIDDLSVIESRLRLVGAVQRQWLGEPAEWTDVARGPAFTAPRVVDDGRGRLDLPPGALRLMIRAWIVPDWAGSPEGPGAAMRVELRPDHVHTGRERFPGYARDPSPVADALDALRWNLILRPGEACVIVPESPETRWDQPVPQPGSPSTGGVGPTPPALATVGEAMLSVDREAGPPRRVRAVIVLIPRLPARYRLSAAGD